MVKYKLWRGRVSDEKVAALATICDDLGADRGLLPARVPGGGVAVAPPLIVAVHKDLPPGIAREHNPATAAG